MNVADAAPNPIMIGMAPSMAAQGHVRYRLKTAYCDSTTDVVFAPLDVLARLAAPVPTPANTSDMTRLSDLLIDGKPPMIRIMSSRSTPFSIDAED